MFRINKPSQFFLLQAIISGTCSYAKTTGNAQNQTIQWGPCSINGTLPLTCANISVPLDYSDSSSTETLTIELIKATATKQPSKGSFLVNFGGPGASGQELLASLGAQLQATTGGYHDIISYDPRGAGKTLPFICYENATERTIARLQNPYLNGNHSDITIGSLWASAENFASACYVQSKDIGELVGMAFTARDLISIVDLLGEDGLLRYYGLSGGTVQGAITAAMFPERIDRMVLDGVWNIHEYVHYHAVEGFSDSDATFSAYLGQCVKVGSACALSQLNKTAPELEKSIYELIQKVKYFPIPYDGILINYTVFRNVIFLAITTVALYPALATFLHALLTDDLAELGTVWDLLSPGEESIDTEHRASIQCGDKPKRTENLADLHPVYNDLYETSKLAGDRADYDVDFCSRWKFHAKERYLGDFNVKTRTPLLIVGSTYEPVTPLVSGKNASASFQGSVVLQHDGYGHTSLQQASRCTASVVQNYLVNGTLPEPGTICEVDVPLFSNITWSDVLDQP